MTLRSPNELRKAFATKHYILFDQGDYNLNIIGERASERRSNSFDDTIHLLFKRLGQWHVWSAPVTTDPGKYYLLNPLNPDGTLIMLPGQYIGAYKLGVHGRGKWWGYSALEQVSPIDFYRDNNGNDILDIPPIRLDDDTWEFSTRYYRGIFKANIHRASKYKLVQYVERYSAGCQVFQSYQDWGVFMEHIHKAAERYGDRFTYTLLNEEDFTNA